MPTRPRPPLATLTEALTSRLGYKAAALFFAVAIWVAASGEEAVARYVDVRLVPVLDEDVRLAGTVPRVRALVVGPARELLELYASPPILRRAVGEDPGDSVVLELRPSDVDLPPDVGPVSIRDVRPRLVSLRLESLAARRVPVRLEVQVAPGTLGPESDLVVEPDTVLVRGPRRLVQRLDALPTVPRTIAPGDQLGEIALDTAAVGGVQVTPTRVRILVRTRVLPAAVPAPAGDSARPAPDSAARQPTPAGAP